MGNTMPNLQIRILHTLLKLVWQMLDYANFTISPFRSGFINQSLRVELPDTIVISTVLDHSQKC